MSVLRNCHMQTKASDERAKQIGKRVATTAVKRGEDTLTEYEKEVGLFSMRQDETSPF